MKSIPGILELTHNHGTESDPDFAYHNGNTDPRGFGHICISVRIFVLPARASKNWASSFRNA